MGFVFMDWDIWWMRESIKEVFGNQRNWMRFCDIANSMALDVWLHSR